MSADAEFVETHAVYVKGIAAQVRAQLGFECDMDDLIGFGYRGLLEAHQRFDEGKGVKFKSFAHYRVRGAMLDGIRKMAYLPRRAYRRLLAAEALDGEAEFVAQTGAAAPSEPDAAGALRVADGILGRMAAAYCVAAGSEDDAPPDDSPEDRLLRAERKKRTASAIAKLPERERFLIEGHYLQGRRFDELAAELGLSKSWGSRLHSRALGLLRDALSADDPA